MDLTFAKIDAAELKSELQGLDRLAQSFGQSLTGAFLSAAADGRKLSDVLRSLMLSLSRQALTSALKPLGQLVTSALSGVIANAKGNVIASGRITPFASGGIVSGPTLFPLASGLGLMGERGAEAIMPLSRGADGKLGVRAAVARPVAVTLNISTPDAESFRRSSSQVQAALLRALERGERNL
jgi:phage-related minor tail protein